ncbi:MAG: PAS domain-containing protein [Wenzhouxiangella sp.]|jgi:PAS domain-containing protein|nr:PAS domain-containing protein [Wenzhouxiangella sp.]
MATPLPKKPDQLRADAEGLIKQRSTPASSGWTISPDTLELLYRLSSNPDSASDAQKLLHELKTHQVELDLQHAQLLENDHELQSQISYYQALFEQAPASYLVLDRGGRILHSNRATLEIFDLDSEELAGRVLADLLSPSGKSTLTALLEAPKAGLCDRTVRVETLDTQRLRLMVSPASFDQAFLVMLFPDDSAELI